MDDSRAGDIRFVLIAAGAGVAVGLVGTAFHLAANALLVAHRTALAGLGQLEAVAASAAFSALAVLAAVVLVRRFAPEAAGSGVHEIEGALESARPLRWRRVLPVKFLGGILAIGSGLVVGREGPTIHIGASLSFGLSRAFALAEVERKGLTAAGAAAGLAVAFNAPVAAVLFVIEETRRQFPYSFRTYAGVMAASVTATVVTQEIAGAGPDLATAADPVALAVLPAFALLGIVLGAAGVAFNAALLRCLDIVEAVERRLPWSVPLAVGAGIGALVVALPAATGGGETLIPRVVDQTFPVAGLALLVIVRLATTLLCYSVGAPGGIFAPILALATLLGLLFHAFAALFFPAALAGDGAAFAIAAMAALFASSVRAPLVGVVLVAELTGSYEILLPVLIAAAVSHFVAQLLGGEPIYETLLERTLARAGTRQPPSHRRADGVPLELGVDEPPEKTSPPPTKEPETK